jgi:S-formylglutathione hydrolase
VIVLPDRDWPAAVDFSALGDLLSSRGLSAVLIDVPGTWWLDQVEPGFPAPVPPLRFVVDSVVPRLLAEWPTITAIGVFGVGRGGQGALQLAYRWPARFPVVAAISPFIDFHSQYGHDTTISEVFESKEAARQQTVTLHLHPLNWPPAQWFASDPADLLRHDGTERLASKLGSIGIPFTADLQTPAGGDLRTAVEAQLPMAVDFLAERLNDPETINPRSSVGGRRKS